LEKGISVALLRRSALHFRLTRVSHYKEEEGDGVVMDVGSVLVLPLKNALKADLSIRERLGVLGRGRLLRVSMC
jgi:hypothetical protein